MSKIKLSYHSNGAKYTALFSNVGSEKENEFYLLMTYHHSKKGGFGEPISVEKCKSLLKSKGLTFIQ